MHLDVNTWVAIAGGASAVSAALNLVVVCVNVHYTQRSTLAFEAEARASLRPNMVLSASPMAGENIGLFTLHLKNAGPGSCHEPRLWRKGEFFQFNGTFEAMPQVQDEGYDVSTPNDHLIPASGISDCMLAGAEGVGATGYILEFADAMGNREQIHFFATALPGSVHLTILGTSFCSARQAAGKRRRKPG